MQSVAIQDSGLSVEDGIAQAIEGIEKYGSLYDDWRIAFSGGKDSTALAALVCWLLITGKVKKPKRIFVTISDTRQELPPLIENAHRVASLLEEKIDAKTIWVGPSLEKTFLYQLLGRGVYTPGMNGRNRWCTRVLKTEPMNDAAGWMEQYGVTNENSLLLYGSRVDESNARAKRMAHSCTLEGSECGSGLYMENEGPKYAPLTNWRNCATWDWLMMSRSKIGYDWTLLFNLYGKTEAKDVLNDMDKERSPEEIAEAIDATTRTGCMGCPVVGHDYALDRICQWPEWSHLSPYKRLRPLYVELRNHNHRLKKELGERTKKGELVENQCRVGPICIESRKWALLQIVEMQNEVVELAKQSGAVPYILMGDELRIAIEKAIDANTWPRGWTGEEPNACEQGRFGEMRKGVIQPFLF